MAPQIERPASGGDRGGPSSSVQPGGGRAEVTGKLIFRIDPNPDGMIVRGRVAETLRLLITTGERGFTSGEASRFGWARRTSHYVFKLRSLGVAVATVRERVGDAWVGRYVLQSPVVLLSQGEDAR